jgi:hypothetical protein
MDASGALGSGGASANCHRAALPAVLPLMVARARNLSSTQQKPPIPSAKSQLPLPPRPLDPKYLYGPTPEIPETPSLFFFPPLPLASSSSRLHPPLPPNRGAGESVGALRRAHAAVSCLGRIWVFGLVVTLRCAAFFFFLLRRFLRGREGESTPVGC